MRRIALPSLSSLLLLLSLAIPFEALGAANPRMWIEPDSPADRCIARDRSSPDDCLCSSTLAPDELKACIASMTRLSFIGGFSTAILNQLSAPESCMSCQLIAWIVRVIRAIGQAAFDVLVGTVLALSGALFVLWLAWTLGRQLVGLTAGSGRSGWRSVSDTGLRFLLILVVFGAFSAPGTGSGVVYEWIFSNLLSPVMELAAVTGTELLPISAQAGGSARIASFSDKLDQATAANVAYVGGSGVGASAGSGDGGALLDALVKLATGLHLIGQVGVARSIAYITEQDSYAQIGAWASVAVGVVLLVFFLSFVVVAGLRLVDPVLRLAVALALSPLLFAAYVFPAFRGTAATGARLVAYAALYLVVAGAVYGVVFAMLVESMAASCGEGAPQAFEALMVSVSGDGSATLPKCPVTAVVAGDAARHPDIASALILLVGLFLGQALIASVGTMAGSIASYSAQDNIASGAESQIRGLATTSAVTVAYTGVSAAMSGLKIAKRTTLG